MTMLIMKTYIAITFLFLTLLTQNINSEQVDTKKFIVWGIGLNPEIRIPGRYFFIHAVDKNGKKFTSSPPQLYNVDIKGTSSSEKCPHSVNMIDRGDGSVIIRYKIFEWCENVKIIIKYNGTDVADSPYNIGKIYSDECYCPKNTQLWLLNNSCPKNDPRIDWDLIPFKKVNFTSIRDPLLKRYNLPGSVSLCHYVVKSQEIYRTCYGKYTGFKMFMDKLLLSLNNQVLLPDMEFYLNLGDWPLSKKGGQQRTSGPYPIFSWCGSDDSYDIVLPTYDLTESTLENMGKVTLDILSVQRSLTRWADKEPKAFWRGRDSRRERLKLIDLARTYPDLINASITNFFFFKEEEKKYGPKVAHISFMDFFKYKYQISIDGTVASYRIPYLLGGDSLLLKQDSPFYEHFYTKMIPYKHFIPFKRDLSDLIEKIQWAKKNENQVKEIVNNARSFVVENLLPHNIYCYHVMLFSEWSKRLVTPILVLPEMEKVEKEIKCSCDATLKDEL